MTVCPGTCVEVRAHSQELVLFFPHVGLGVTLGASGLAARALHTRHLPGQLLVLPVTEIV